MIHKSTLSKKTNYRRDMLVLAVSLVMFFATLAYIVERISSH